jgi:hypothetical protein
MDTPNTTFTIPTTAAEANRIGVSLCIPRIFNNINHRRIKNWFIQNLRQWGFVERVDVVPVFKQGKQVHKRAYIHYAKGRFNMKADDGEGGNILEAFVTGDTIQVVYDDPWYWKLSLSRAARPAEAPKPRAAPTVKIQRAEEKVPDMSGAAALVCEATTTTPKEKIERAKTVESPALSREVCRDISCDEEEWSEPPGLEAQDAN